MNKLLKVNEEDAEKLVLVFDFGGGTFDVSVMEISEGYINVEATRGDTNLGGRDLDEVLLNHCLQEFRKATGSDLSKDR